MNDEFTSIALSELRVKQAWDLDKKKLNMQKKK